MSGGSFGYLYNTIERELYGEMRDIELDEFVVDFAKVVHDLEWFVSSDIDEDDYRETVRNFKKKWFSDSRAERLTLIVDKRIGELRKELLNVIGYKENPSLAVDFPRIPPKKGY